MKENYIEKLQARNQMLESDNRLLKTKIDQLKRDNKDLKQLLEKYKKEIFYFKRKMGEE